MLYSTSSSSFPNNFLWDSSDLIHPYESIEPIEASLPHRSRKSNQSEDSNGLNIQYKTANHSSTLNGDDFYNEFSQKTLKIEEENSYINSSDEVRCDTPSSEGQFEPFRNFFGHSEAIRNPTNENHNSNIISKTEETNESLVTTLPLENSDYHDEFSDIFNQASQKKIFKNTFIKTSHEIEQISNNIKNAFKPFKASSYFINSAQNIKKCNFDGELFVKTINTPEYLVFKNCIYRITKIGEGTQSLVYSGIRITTDHPSENVSVAIKMSKRNGYHASPYMQEHNIIQKLKIKNDHRLDYIDAIQDFGEVFKNKVNVFGEISKKYFHIGIYKISEMDFTAIRHSIPLEIHPHNGFDNLKIINHNPFSQLLPKIINIAQAIEFLHEEGWVHRDIKPANCLWNHNGPAKLTDFGCLMATPLPNSKHSTAMTPVYAAPFIWENLTDQLNRMGNQAEESDTFAFGLFLKDSLVTILKTQSEITPTLKEQFTKLKNKLNPTKVDYDIIIDKIKLETLYSKQTRVIFIKKQPLNTVTTYCFPTRLKNLKVLNKMIRLFENVFTNSEINKLNKTALLAYDLETETPNDIPNMKNVVIKLNQISENVKNNLNL